MPSALDHDVEHAAGRPLEHCRATTSCTDLRADSSPLWSGYAPNAGPSGGGGSPGSCQPPSDGPGHAAGGRGLRPADLEALQRLGISPELLEAAQISRVTHDEARDACGIRYRSDHLAGIWYPSLDPERGTVRSGRVRRDHPEHDRHGRSIAKYVGLPDRHFLYFPPDVGPLLRETNASIVIVEAEKSALAVTAAAARAGRRLLAIATGGCWGWRGTTGKTTNAAGARVDEKGPLPDFDRLAWRDRDVVLLFDANAATNLGVHGARRALGTELTTRGARVRIAELSPEAEINGPDDFVARYGDVALWALIDGAQPTHQASAADVLRLAGLDDIHDIGLADLEGRLRTLKEELQGADTLRRRTVREILVATLKAAKVGGAAALADAAIGGAPDATDPGTPAFLADEAPWPDRVDGATLLDALVATVRRYVVLPDVHAARAIVLWIVLSYCDAVVNVLPLLLVTSPTKRCGKTPTVEIVGALACRALPISNITAAALYRAIETVHPTLLLDEGDTFINDDPELRGVINAGHTRHTARVIRCVGDDSEPNIFSTWCPKLVAMIGTPKDTLVDRSQRDCLSTARVTELLAGLDSRPWATYNAKTGKPVTQYQVARLLKRFGVRPIKAKVEAKATNCYDRGDLEPAWTRYSLPLSVGTSEPVNDSGPQSAMAGRNHDENGSDRKSIVPSIETGLVPRFRPEDPRVGRERVEL